MTKEEVIILNRNDLTIHNNNKEFSEIKYDDFRIPNEFFYKANIILFIDTDSRTKILKNRFGYA
ncbi:hypothetical protein M0Q97_04820 [Candidatus Dojkabacteria bacterium]|jgi:hypothetical protein|nr:hypothetical protein [Candidatus Dojkabacteria bacterium]